MKYVFFSLMWDIHSSKLRYRYIHACLLKWCMSQMIDDIDRRILRQMQADPMAPQAELAGRARLPVATLARRVERMREVGVLRGIRAEIDWRALGYAVEVSLRVTLDKTQRDAFDVFMTAARTIPEVTEIQTFLGKVDVRLNVLARDMMHYQQIYRDHILALPHISDIEALMLVADLKTDESLPL